MLDMYGNVISGKMICRIVLIPLIIAFNVSDFFITRYFHSPCFFFTHALRELMKDDLEDARKLGESEGKAMGEVVGEAKIILKMNHSGMSPENIASITGKDLDEIHAILEGKVPVLG